MVAAPKNISLMKATVSMPPAGYPASLTSHSYAIASSFTDPMAKGRLLKHHNGAELRKLETGLQKEKKKPFGPTLSAK
jgi:hypothetical protein